MKYLPLFCVAMLLAACSKSESVAPVTPTVMVQSIPQNTAHAMQRQIYTGEIRPRYEYDAAFRVGGKIRERRVDVGERVEAGAVLARLEPQDLELSQRGAQAAVNAAKADRQLAGAELARSRKLHREGFVSETALQIQQTRFAAASAALKQAQARAAVAANQSDYTVLRASEAGIVSGAHAEAGQVVGAGQPVFHIVRSSPREVAIHVPEDRVAEISVGREAQVFSLAGRAHGKGYVREVAPVAERPSRVYEVRVALTDESAQQLPLGSSANVVFMQSQEGLIRLPLRAVSQHDGVATIWLVDEHQVLRQRAVEVARFEEAGALIRQGVAPGDQVVVMGVERLVADTQVNVVNAAETVALDVQR